MNNYIIMVYHSYGQVAKHRITAMNCTDAIPIAYKRHNVGTCGDVWGREYEF